MGVKLFECKVCGERNLIKNILHNKKYIIDDSGMNKLYFECFNCGILINATHFSKWIKEID